MANRFGSKNRRTKHNEKMKEQKFQQDKRIARSDKKKVPIF